MVRDVLDSCWSCCLQVLGQSTGRWCPAGRGLGLRALGECEPVSPQPGRSCCCWSLCVAGEMSAVAWGHRGGQNCMLGSSEYTKALRPNGLMSLMGNISQLLPAQQPCCPSTPENREDQRVAAPFWFWFWSHVLVSSMDGHIHVRGLGRRMHKAILSTAASDRSPSTMYLLTAGCAYRHRLPVFCDALTPLTCC